MENEIIKSETFNVKPICTIGAIVVGIVGLLTFGAFFQNRGESIAEKTIIPALIVAIILLVIRWWLGSMEIVVTDKRVYGRAAFGKRVDLPIDSISAVSTSLMHGITVATSSGIISFKFIENNEDIHKIISNMLVNRQDKNESMTAIKPEVAQSSADEIAKFKALLDEGVITQEEFDAKKKQLLGL